MSVEADGVPEPVALDVGVHVLVPEHASGVVSPTSTNAVARRARKGAMNGLRTTSYAAMVGRRC
ncbi:MAG TPA: hypothetical protein VMP67_05855 [Candidatus Limnocylindria bacterium]|nr:hypothetical protein [Candidatus Limnocylindria bacterium]